MKHLRERACLAEGELCTAGNFWHLWQQRLLTFAVEAVYKGVSTLTIASVPGQDRFPLMWGRNGVESVS